ncbi:phosphate ABC transporter substrate-binding protein PstS [Mycobacterium sp.]|uniref:phosphate ABC transporter substrate-binding protein PstS n=1 Tax=Mycobacterium sp. TaxID=1785 RepID=UPI003D6C107B
MRLHTVVRVLGAVVLTGVLSTGCGSDNNNLGSGFGASIRVDCGGDNALTGEGSTAQQNAIALFNQAWGRQCPSKNVLYNPTGSGAGREQFIAGHVDFGGSDEPLTAVQIGPAAKRCNGNPAWHLPLVFGPVAVIYHLGGVAPLVVNADVLAKIFSGAIISWRDPAIVALNHNVGLPDAKITPIYRADSSGTTDNFQKYLTVAAPRSWTQGAGSEFQGGVGEGAQKSAGVVQAVQSTPGTIGYVEKGFADQAGMPYAQIDDGGGAVALSDDAARNAVDDATFVGVGNDLRLDLDSLYATTEPGAYPLVLATYEIVCSAGYDPATGTAVKSFLTTAADSGQAGLSKALSGAGYVPLPDKFQQRLVAAISAIQ